MKENNQFSNIRKFFNTVKNQGNHLHIDGKSGMDQDHYDYVTARFNKRITSTEKYVDRAQKELVELGDKVFVRENYIFSNTLICCGGYNYLDRILHFFLYNPLGSGDSSLIANAVFCKALI